MPNITQYMTMSLVVKNVLGCFDQVRHKPAYADTREDIIICAVEANH